MLLKMFYGNWPCLRRGALWRFYFFGASRIRDDRVRGMGVAIKFLILIASSTCLNATADVYVFRDVNGVEHFTNQAGVDGASLVVAMLSTENRVDVVKSTKLSARAHAYAPQVDAAAAEYKVDSALLHAVISVESGYNASALSPKGAQGLMQLMPGTARRYDVADPFDPQENIRGGAKYLRDLLSQFDNKLDLAVAAYNAGENAVLKYGKKIPPYPETQAYVPKVLRLYEKIRIML